MIVVRGGVCEASGRIVHNTYSSVFCPACSYSTTIYECQPVGGRRPKPAFATHEMVIPQHNRLDYQPCPTCGHGPDTLGWLMRDLESKND